MCYIGQRRHQKIGSTFVRSDGANTTRNCDGGVNQMSQRLTKMAEGGSGKGLCFEGSSFDCIDWLSEAG